MTLPKEGRKLGIYESLGVSPVINAAGTLTRLGGTVMRPEVRDAMSEAAGSLVPIDELQAAASKAIAEACGSDAGYVASGASAGLTLGTAACMVGLDVAAWPGAIGAAFAAGYLALLGISVLRLALTRPRLAEILLLGRRVLGAWVAAMGLLLGTLAVRTMA